MKKCINFATFATLPVICLFLLSACDAGSVAQTGAPTAIAAREAPAGATKAAPTGATTVPAGNKQNSKLDCQALANAFLDLELSQPFLTTLVSGGDAANRPDSPFYVDTSKIRADLDILAALPDSGDQVELAMLGKPSEAITQFRQVVDSVDKNARADASGTPVGTPAGGGSMSDTQLLDLTTRLVKMYGSLSSAIDHVCPGVTGTPAAGIPANGQGAPLKASYAIGQTAPVGALRVTLDKVVTVPGRGSTQLTPGNRYILAYLTVENTGKTPFSINPLLAMHFEDATGKRYTGDPYSTSLDPATTNFEGAIQPAEKRSGASGFQLPTNAGDLVWVFQDFRPNTAAFTVKVSDVQAVGTPVTEATEQAQRSAVAATQTAFVTMMVGAAATEEAAGTATPEPTETPAPAEATETPAPAEATETPGASP